MTDINLQHLMAAQGWLELGLPAEAFAELDRIPAERRAHPDVLEMRWEVYRRAEKWNEAVEVTDGLIRLAPERFTGWWMRSFALHVMKRTQDAYDNLVSVRQKFAVEFLMHYNLACYLTQLGRLEEARASLAHAFELNPDHRTAALEDPDLEPLWTETQRK